MGVRGRGASGCDPRSRAGRVMRREEAHHMIVGETGVQRVIERTVQAMNAAGIMADSHE